MTITSGIIIALTFVTGFLAIFAVNLVLVDLFERDRKQRLKQTEAELRLRQRERAKEASGSLQSENLADLAAEAFHDPAADRKSLLKTLDELIEQAGVEMSAGRLIVMTLATGGIVGLPAGFLTGSLLWGGLLGLSASVIPYAIVRLKRAQRLETMRGQLPDTFDLMSRTLRAGQTMTQAMYSVSTEFRAPIATEFGYCYEQQNLGLPPEFALRDLARRTSLLEIKIFVVAILIHRTSGGNLAELLEKLAAIVRDRFRIRSKIKALTAEGRFQALILLGLPFFVFGAMMVMNRPYAIKLFEHPYLIGGALTSMALGAVWMQKIITFDI